MSFSVYAVMLITALCKLEVPCCTKKYCVVLCYIMLCCAVLCCAVLCCDCCNLAAGGQQHRCGEQDRWQEQTSAYIIRV